MSKQKTLKGIAFFVAILILLLVMIYSGLQILESTVFRSSQDTTEKVSTKTITRDSVDYFPKQDITVLMVMGIDQYGPMVPSESYNNPGAADVVMLLVFDETNEKCDVLHLNRDTMLEIPVLGIGGKPAGTYYGQLALAHTFGTGMEDSCENTKKAVSDFLYGINIDYYVAMNMDVISIMNDAVGGVTVTVEHDFSQVDPTIEMGEMTLMGEQAINFIRTRKNVGDQLNLTRIERQKEYIEGFVEAFKAKREQSDSFVVSAFEEVSEYIVTDCSVNTLSSMMDRYEDYEISEILSPEGENVMGEEYFEFHADQEKLDDLIVKLFYAPKK